MTKKNMQKCHPNIYSTFVFFSPYQIENNTIPNRKHFLEIRHNSLNLLCCCRNMRKFTIYIYNTYITYKESNSVRKQSKFKIKTNHKKCKPRSMSTNFFHLSFEISIFFLIIHKKYFGIT